MDFLSLADALHVSEEFLPELSDRWEDSEAVFPEQTPDFLTEGFIRKYYPLIRYQEEDLVPELIAAARKIAGNENTLHLAWHLYYRTFLNPKGTRWMKSYDLDPSIIGEREAGLFNLLVAMGSAPLIIEGYRKKNIPEKYALAQLPWLGATIASYRASHKGNPGHRFEQTAWLRHPIEGRLFRFGRFEFVLENYPAFAPAIYVHNTTGKVAVFARGGWNYDASDRICEPENTVFKATLREDGKSVTGNRLAYDGKLDKTLSKIDFSEYHALCAPWSQILTFHIPAGGGMKPELVPAAMKEAILFFREYFSMEIPAVFCCSWILNPAWRELLPQSNIANFQKSTFRIDLIHKPGSRTGLSFIFGKDSGTPEEYTQKTSMEKAMIRAWKEDRLQANAMFVPANAIDKYGHPELF